MKYSTYDNFYIQKDQHLRKRERLVKSLISEFTDLVYEGIRAIYVIKDKRISNSIWSYSIRKKHKFGKK